MDSVAGGSLCSSTVASGVGDSLRSPITSSFPPSQFFDPISYLNSMSSSSPPPRPPARSLSPPSPPLPSRKRSRSARRPHTTVLNTDTSNFRAMVQQFTGVAYPPFDLAAASASFSRPRLNLFDSATQPPPPPFSQKPQNISSTDLNLNTTTSHNPSFGPQIENAQSQILALQSLLPLLGANQQGIGLQPAIAGVLSSWPTGPLPESGASLQRATSYTTKNQNQQGSSSPAPNARQGSSPTVTASSSKGEEKTASNYTIESWIN
ncbi:flocculation protein FLO11-like [Zingiber officinale]|uniref:flocculation protein FLO11-like n=1 Tax=Zingiber officinale TaxID=94328 RepID=UPI001C4D3B6D|nr:flocculation protein FLO11-like [Zingiber officinale]